jgi:hypothetical protein
MNLENPARETLRYLFAEYKKGPGVIYRITDVARKYGVDALALSDYLLERSWIRERWIYSDDDVACRITTTGIREVDPPYYHNRVGQIIESIAASGRSKPLREILEYKVEDFIIASDFVNHLEQLGLIKIGHPDNTIIVELTDQGMRYHDKKEE